MSLKISRGVWQLVLKCQPKSVLLALADFANDDGYCYASIKKLAHKCGLGRSTTARHLQWLRHQGFLQITHQYRQSGSRACNAYQIKNVELSPPCPKLESQNLDAGLDKLSDRDKKYINGYYNDHKNVLDPDLGLNENSNHSSKPALKGAI